MYPYIVKVSGLQPGADPAVDPGAQPRLSYGSLNPIKLPDTKTSNWLDPSLFEKDGVYYLNIKKNGVTNQIYSIGDLSQAGNPKAWRLMNDNVVTGYEGPSLTYYNGQYFSSIPISSRTIRTAKLTELPEPLSHSHPA